MIVPDPDDTDLNTKIAADFLTRYSNLYENFSPILPLHFNKSYLPKNICERQLIDLFQCTVFKYHEQPSSCSYYVASFQQCRKNRDLRILQAIKQWQSQHVKDLDKDNRRMYLQGLTFKLNRLKQQYNKIPSNQNKQMKLHQLQSQIQQLKWRMKHIQSIIN